MKKKKKIDFKAMMARVQVNYVNTTGKPISPAKARVSTSGLDGREREARELRKWRESMMPRKM